MRRARCRAYSDQGGGTSWTPAVYSRIWQQEAVLNYYRCRTSSPRVAAEGAVQFC